jgi:hypothetical protein
MYPLLANAAISPTVTVVFPTPEDVPDITSTAAGLLVSILRSLIRVVDDILYLFIELNWIVDWIVD